MAEVVFYQFRVLAMDGLQQTRCSLVTLCRQVCVVNSRHPRNDQVLIACPAIARGTGCKFIAFRSNAIIKHRSRRAMFNRRGRLCSPAKNAVRVLGKKLLFTDSRRSHILDSARIGAEADPQFAFVT
jgi:hypothetical protein